MKILLSGLGEWCNRRWKAILFWLLAAEACILVFPVFRQAPELETKSELDLTSIPEPETCALCEGFRHHAPCLVRLDTGEVGELRVYDPDPIHREEISAVQQTGTFSFVHCAGILAVRDTDAHTCSAELSEKPGSLAQEYFCINCRGLLAETASAGYVLADLYDLGNICIYPIRDGASHSIRDYEVTIKHRRGRDNLYIKVAGQL